MKIKKEAEYLLLWTHYGTYKLVVEPYKSRKKFLYESNKGKKLSERIIEAFYNLGYTVHTDFKVGTHIIYITYVGQPLENGVLVVFEEDEEIFNDYMYDTIELCDIVRDVQNTLKNER